jgi:hypothetical protein
MTRKGGRGKCAACEHEKQDDLNADLISKISLSKLSEKYGISRASLKAHKDNHLTPALAAVQAEKFGVGTKATARLEAMLQTVESLLTKARTTGNVGQALTAVRELRATIELLAKITGELDERPTTVINLLTTEAWIQARQAIVEALAPYPEARLAVANRLQLIEHRSD